jgi:hypothetical protein
MMPPGKTVSLWTKSVLKGVYNLPAADYRGRVDG